jgi:hypothetical protein
MWPPPPRPIGATVGMLGSSDSTLVSGESKPKSSLSNRTHAHPPRTGSIRRTVGLWRTYRSHRHLRHRHVPEPRTPAHPPVRPPTRISSGPCTLRSPRSAIPMTPSVAPKAHPACPDADRAPLRPPPLTPRHELQRATAPGLAGSRLRSERVGGWRGPGPGPPVRSPDAPGGPHDCPDQCARPRTV